MTRQFGWDTLAFGFGPRGFFWRGPRRGRRQWFASGDMKYVILKLLKDKPRLRSDEGAGGAAARLLLPVARNRLSDAAVPRGRRARGGEGRRRQEGVRD